MGQTARRLASGGNAEGKRHRERWNPLAGAAEASASDGLT